MTSAGDTSPEQLLVEVGRGSRAAFERLYPYIAGPVYSLAMRIVRDPVHAEDIAQNALITVWRTATGYDPARGDVLTWVLTIAHRRAVDWIRSEQAHRDRERRAAANGHQTNMDTTVDIVLREHKHAEIREN